MELKTCIRVVDEQGRFAPLFDENATMRIRADHIIFAIGEASELNGFAKDVRTERGRIEVEDVTFATSTWGIFAAGDAATGPSSVCSDRHRRRTRMRFFHRPHAQGRGHPGRTAGANVPISLRNNGPAKASAMNRDRSASAIQLPPAILLRKPCSLWIWKPALPRPCAA